MASTHVLHGIVPTGLQSKLGLMGLPVTDSIEANVERAEVYVERGTGQLQKAVYHQQKSRRKKCILALVLSVAVTILGVIIWGATKN